MVMLHHIVVERLHIRHQRQRCHAEAHTFMTITHHHHPDMGVVVLVVEDHIGIQGNRRIRQPIHLRTGEQLDGIKPILHLRIPILFMDPLRIMAPHQIILILPHHLIMADTKITT